MIDDEVPNSTVRLLVFEAIRSYPSDALLLMLDDEDTIVRMAVARELQVRGEKKAFDHALLRCDDLRDFVREIAAFTLGQFGTPTYPFRSESIPKLAELAVHDPSFEVRATAVASLGHLHAEESMQVLLESANDPEADVRAMAAVSLGRLGPLPEVVETLDKLLSDPDSEVREWAQLGVELTEDDDLVAYFDRKGGLHDCVIESLVWQPMQRRVEIRIEDINANSLGLPEYVGLVPCVIEISGINDFTLDISNADDRLRVYEASVSAVAEKKVLKIAFSPSGSLEASFAVLTLSELDESGPGAQAAVGDR
ncbi:HEAT repeat protein [Luteibacter sp. OK325]|uniref:HEAT repeat domain-containing protein n=1 Tax=Luteibacter sp. OK325 TaxID=2135670 RepID=UPI000D45C513|nr:HEAT repeat domain-containing protein [Luteibacter sp. OK325]PTR26300.1 HEAT repeat protein [Luteibacter sp. OK325]